MHLLKGKKIYSAVVGNCLSYFHHFKIFTVSYFKFFHSFSPTGECIHIPQHCKAMKDRPIKITILQNSSSLTPFVAHTYRMKQKDYRDYK